MNTDDFKGIDQHTITRRQIKVLLGALSYTYDDAQRRMGLNPQIIRDLSHQFEGDCKSLPDDVYRDLRKKNKVSFNLFLAEDVHDVPDGWTDYGEEEYHYYGFLIENNPFNIRVVKYHWFSQEFMFPNSDPTIEHIETTDISSIDAFRRFGSYLFVKIADIVDWDVIIKSFGNAG